MKLLIEINDQVRNVILEDGTLPDDSELRESIANGIPLNECNTDNVPTITITIEEYMKFRELEKAVTTIRKIIV